MRITREQELGETELIASLPAGQAEAGFGYNAAFAGREKTAEPVPEHLIYNADLRLSPDSDFLLLR